MGKPASEIVLIHPQTITANGNTGTIIIPQSYWGAILYLNVGTVTGTSPNLNIWIQQGFRAPSASADTTDGAYLATVATPTLWDDYAAFANPITATGVSVMRIIGEIGTSAANSPTASVLAAQAGAQTASTVKAGPLGMWWRVLWTVAGTTPSYAGVYLTAQFLISDG